MKLDYLDQMALDYTRTDRAKDFNVFTSPVEITTEEKDLELTEELKSYKTSLPVASGIMHAKCSLVLRDLPMFPNKAKLVMALLNNEILKHTALDLSEVAYYDDDLSVVEELYQLFGHRGFPKYQIALESYDFGAFTEEEILHAYKKICLMNYAHYDFTDEEYMALSKEEEREIRAFAEATTKRIEAEDAKEFEEYKLRMKKLKEDK